MGRYLFIDCGALLLTASTCTLLLVHSLVPRTFYNVKTMWKLLPLFQQCLVGNLFSIQPFSRLSAVWSNYLFCRVHPFFWHFLLHYYQGRGAFCMRVTKASSSLAWGAIMCSVMFTLFFLHPSLPGPPPPPTTITNTIKLCSAHILSSQSLPQTHICIMVKFHNW